MNKWTYFDVFVKQAILDDLHRTAQTTGKAVHGSWQTEYEDKVSKKNNQQNDN